MEVGREDELEFGLVLVVAAEVAVGAGKVGLAIVTDELEDRLVGAGGVLVLHIEDWVDGVVAHERPDPILNAEAGKNGGILGCGLAIEVDLGGPPGAGAVLELYCRSSEVGAAIWFTEGGFGFDLEVAGLLQIVGVGDGVGLVLREGGGVPRIGKQAAMQKAQVMNLKGLLEDKMNPPKIYD